MKKLLATCLLLYVLSSVVGCNSDKNSSTGLSAPSGNEVAAVTTLLATVPAPEPLTAHDPAKENKPPAVGNIFQVSFSDRGWGVAYIIELNGAVRAVLNGKAGKPYLGIGVMVISSDGQHMAYSAFDKEGWRMVYDDAESAIVETLGTPVFSPDSRHLAYDAKINGSWYMFVDKKKSGPSLPHYTYHDKFFSSDSSNIITIQFPADNDKLVRLSVSDVAFRKQIVKEIPASSFVCNRDKSRIALIGENNGKKRVLELTFNKMDSVNEGVLYDDIDKLTYGADGVSVAFVAKRGSDRFVVLNGKEELLSVNDDIYALVVRPDKLGVGIIFSSKDGYFLHQAFDSNVTKTKHYVEAANLIYTGDGSRQAYIANKGKHNIVLVVNGTEGPAFDMIVTPIFSPDGSHLVYRARKDGKRFVVVADAFGKVLRQHPAYYMVYQPVFIADGKLLGYGVKDGQKLIWKVEKL